MCIFNTSLLIRKYTLCLGTFCDSESIRDLDINLLRVKFVMKVSLVLVTKYRPYRKEQWESEGGGITFMMYIS
jgi:hypothetical protein